MPSSWTAPGVRSPTATLRQVRCNPVQGPFKPRPWSDVTVRQAGVSRRKLTVRRFIASLAFRGRRTGVTVVSCGRTASVCRAAPRRRKGANIPTGKPSSATFTTRSSSSRAGGRRSTPRSRRSCSDGCRTRSASGGRGVTRSGPRTAAAPPGRGPGRRSPTGVHGLTAGTGRVGIGVNHGASTFAVPRSAPRGRRRQRLGGGRAGVANEAAGAVEGDQAGGGAGGGSGGGQFGARATSGVMSSGECLAEVAVLRANRPCSGRQPPTRRSPAFRRPRRQVPNSLPCRASWAPPARVAAAKRPVPVGR